MRRVEKNMKNKVKVLIVEELIKKILKIQKKKSFYFNICIYMAAT